MQKNTSRGRLAEVNEFLPYNILEIVLLHSTQSGLTEACRNSKISIEDAQEQILNFVELHTNPGECPLAGNSIGEDKRFLYRYMPKLVNHLHYRIIDVSTIKELGK